MVFYVWTPIADRGSGARRGPGAGPLLHVRSEGDRVAVARDGAPVDLCPDMFSNRDLSYSATGPVTSCGPSSRPSSTDEYTNRHR